MDITRRKGPRYHSWVGIKLSFFRVLNLAAVFGGTKIKTNRNKKCPKRTLVNSSSSSLEGNKVFYLLLPFIRKNGWHKKCQSFLLQPNFCEAHFNGESMVERPSQKHCCGRRITKHHWLNKTAHVLEAFLMIECSGLFQEERNKIALVAALGG